MGKMRTHNDTCIHVVLLSRKLEYEVCPPGEDHLNTGWRVAPEPEDNLIKDPSKVIASIKQKNDIVRNYEKLQEALLR